VRRLLFALTALATACASTPPAPAGLPEEPLPGAGADTVPPPPAPTAAATCDAFVRPLVLRRGTVVRAVDRGLGQWLQAVKVAPVSAGRVFQGWRVERLPPDDPCFRGLDVLAGDVVTRINGATLERPEDANGVFQSLRTAPALEVDLLRAGSARRLKLEISD
jgi:S1-C subfamily serine protease